MASRKLVRLSMPKPKTKNIKRRQKVDQSSEVDYVPTNAHSSPGESPYYILEDNEAVIKMIIEGRSPTMRHVSRTHRVALEWLCDRINLDPHNPNPICCWNQKPHSLTFWPKGSFSRDEWNHLLCLFNITSFRHIPAAISKVFSLKPQSALWLVCHVETRSRHNLEWWGLRWRKS